MSSASAENSENWLKLYDGLLAKYVTPVGVKYAEWKKSATDRQALQKVVDAIAQANVATSGKEDQLAFYLNAYNAWILHEALAKYPTRSVKDPLFAFFLGKRIKVTGEEMSFNHLEKDIVRARFEEPRVHFALNCASRSCPPLNRQAFRGRELESQLEKLSRAFVNSENGVKVSADKKSAQWPSALSADSSTSRFSPVKHELPLETSRSRFWSLRRSSRSCSSLEQVR
jgi:hypothetical protein